jgi:hypothetical protein
MNDPTASPNYRSLVPGGFFSSDPPRPGHLGDTAVRSNNPGAVNASHPWIEQFPGYVYKCETTPGNWTAIFEAPEFGVALWWKVLQNYEKALTPAFTLHNLIYTYCGQGREQQARDYTNYVCQRTHLTEDYLIDLTNDPILLQIARAFFRYEAGRESPLLDAQILYGFNYARNMTLAPMASLAAAHLNNL